MIFRATVYNFIFNAPTTGRTWDVYVSKDGGNYTLTTNSSASDFVGDGSYHFYASDTDMDANIINFKIIENNNPLYYDEPMQYEINIVTDDPVTAESSDYLINQLPLDVQGLQEDISALQSDMTDLLAMRFPGAADGTVVWTYTMYTDQDYNVPLENCLVKMTADADGIQDLKEQYSNSAGETRWLVVPGETYYLWRQKEHWRFINPDVQEIGLFAPFNSSSSYIDQPVSPNYNDGEYPGDGDAIWTYKVYDGSDYSSPLDTCWVRLTKDIEGSVNLGEQFTDGAGETKWLVVPGGTYYLWRQKKNYSFNDPDIQIINLVEPYSASI